MNKPFILATFLLMATIIYAYDAGSLATKSMERMGEYMDKIDNRSLQIKTDNETQSRVNKAFEQYEANIRPQVKEWQERIDVSDDNEITFTSKTPQKENKKKDDSLFKLEEGERLYIFMSSSIPMNVWKEYVRTVDNNGLNDAVTMLLRGCVGGCQKIHPTAKFIQSVLMKNKHDVEDLYMTEVMIDPMLFKKYGIQRVPCFVYGEGIKIKDMKISEGLTENIDTDMNNQTMSCGDWNFKYHISQLYDKTHSKSLKRMLDKVNSNDFYSNN